eukprot:scaffold17765_cov71-Phaeocystis_antarctica.AAC.1
MPVYNRVSAIIAQAFRFHWLYTGALADATGRGSGRRRFMHEKRRSHCFPVASMRPPPETEVV